MQTVFAKYLWALAVVLLAGTEVTASGLAVELTNETPLDNVLEDQSDLSYRLPNDTYPEHYYLTLTTNVDQGETSFQGEVIIDIVALKNTKRIVLHALELEILKVILENKAKNDDLEELLYVHDTERQFLILSRQTEQLFTADQKYKLTITYRGELRNDKKGFYITKYNDDEGSVHFLATAKFESVNARYCIPCYDEPHIRANFTIAINHSPEYHAISNMPVNEDKSSIGKTVFLTTDPIPSYVVTFTVSDFKFSEGIYDGIKNRMYSRANALDKHDWAFVRAMFIVKHLSKYLGIEFMLPKIDYVAIPETSTIATENFGLIAFGEQNILTNTTTADAFGKFNPVLLSAHEIAHQWFGGYVTLQWWSYLWLKEGFATLLSYKTVDSIFPEWNAWQNFHTFEYQNALKGDAGNDVKPMTFYGEKPDDIVNLYSGSGLASYAKATCVLHMWNNALSEKVFKLALHNFLIENQYKAVGEEELFLSFEKTVAELDYVLPASIREMMLSWTQQGGFPLLNVTRNYTDGSFTITQEAFYNKKTFVSDKIWYIPINYAVAANPDYRNTTASHYMLNVKEITVPAKIAENDWLLLNKQSTGYYRIYYDARNWKLITESLVDRPSTFHVLNRAQLLHDAYCFSMTGRLDKGTVLGLLNYLKHEDEYAPLSTASTIISKYLIFMKGHDNYDDFRFFVAEQLRPVYRRFGSNDIRGENYSHKLIRSIIQDLACQFKVEECLREANNKLKDLINDKIPIEPDLKSTAHCNGLIETSDEIFDYFYQTLMESTDENLRYSLIAAIRCSENEKQLKKLINSSIDKSNILTPEERTVILYATYTRSAIGWTICVEFLKDNWLAYSNLSNDTGNSNPLNVAVRYLAGYIRNKEQEASYLALLDKVKSYERLSSSLESDVLKAISKTFNFIKEDVEPMADWLSKYRTDAEKLSGTDSSIVSFVKEKVTYIFTFIKNTLKTN